MEKWLIYAFLRHQALILQGPLIQPCSHSTESTTTDTKEQGYKIRTWKHTFSNIFSLKKSSLLNLVNQPHQELGDYGEITVDPDSPRCTHVCARSQFFSWKMLTLLVFCFLIKHRSFEAFLIGTSTDRKIEQLWIVLHNVFSVKSYFAAHLYV